MTIREAPSPEDRAKSYRDPSHGGDVDKPENGWIRVTHYDHCQRRAIWLRCSRGCLELRAGREGDDTYAALVEGEQVTLVLLQRLRYIFESNAYAVDVEDIDQACAHCSVPLADSTVDAWLLSEAERRVVEEER